MHAVSVTKLRKRACNIIINYYCGLDGKLYISIASRFSKSSKKLHFVDLTMRP